jgi:putative ABC transport system permease protein
MLRPNQVAVQGVTGAKQAQQIEAALAGVLPIDGSMLTQETGIENENSSGTDSWSVTAVQIGGRIGPPMWGYSLAQDVVGGPQVLQEVTGIVDAKADAVLDQGGVVLFAPGFVQNGHATFVRTHTYPSDDGRGPETTAVTRVTLPAAYVDPAGKPDPGLVIAPSAAAKVAVPGSVSPNLLLDLRTHVTATQSYTANQILGRLGIQQGLAVEDGFVTQLGLANVVVLLLAVLLAIGAAAIATGLALADGRADQETLTAVGGSPWTRRWLAGSTALVITGLGVLIGVPVGFAIAAGLVRASNLAVLMPALGSTRQPSMPLAVPWLDLGVLVLALPLFTSLVAGLLSRSRPPRAGRIEF